MDKETEIKHLQALKGDTYFAQFFSKHDIDQMCENIKNDFAIESDTTFGQLASSYEAKIRNIELAQVETNKETILSIVTSETMMSIEEALHQHFGFMEVIRVKRQNHIELSKDEVDYLYDRLDKLEKFNKTQQ